MLELMNSQIIVLGLNPNTDIYEYLEDQKSTDTDGITYGVTSQANVK